MHLFVRHITVKILAPPTYCTALTRYTPCHQCSEVSSILALRHAAGAPRADCVEKKKSRSATVRAEVQGWRLRKEQPFVVKYNHHQYNTAWGCLCGTCVTTWRRRRWTVSALPGERSPFIEAWPCLACAGRFLRNFEIPDNLPYPVPPPILLAPLQPSRFWLQSLDNRDREGEKRMARNQASAV